MGRMDSSDPHCCKMLGHWFHEHPRKPALDCWEKFSWGVVPGIRLEGWVEFVIGCNSQRGEHLFNKKKHTHKNFEKKKKFKLLFMKHSLSMLLYDRLTSSFVIFATLDLN